MRELNIGQRLTVIEQNILAIKQMLETLLEKQIADPQIDDEKEIMTVKQVAQFLGLDANVIYGKCAKGDIPYFRIGKGYRFRKTDIQRWVQDQKESVAFSVDDYVDKYMQGHILKG